MPSPTFHTNCPDDFHFALMGSHFAQNTITSPCSLPWLSSHKPLSGICTYTKHAQPHPKTPLFLAWTWKWVKWTTVWAKWTRTGHWVKCLKGGQNFSRSGQKKLFICLLCVWASLEEHVYYIFFVSKQEHIPQCSDFSSLSKIKAWYVSKACQSLLLCCTLGSCCCSCC